MTNKHLTQTRFDGFDLDTRILAGLTDAGFTHCTPIQAETLPLALAGRDVAGQAQTGTGKTAAFLLVVMQRLLKTAPPPLRQISHPRALILAPTRELVVQIHGDAQLLAAHTGLRIGLVYGGTGYQQQRDDLAAGVDILIGTPGRLIDYFKQKIFDLQSVEVAVLDEADRMFDLGFIKDIRFLLRGMPPPEARLGLLFSATLSYRVTELAYEYMNRPQLVKIATDTITADRVRQCCYMTANDEKIPLLIGLVRSWENARIMVFVNTKREADRVWGYLQGNGINTAVLSGDVPQNKRLKLLHDFTAGKLPVLVGTDVAARGLHIPDVTHVINYDLPDDPEDYVHRIGRTARAGAAGEAIGFVCETYAFYLPDIETFINTKIPVLPIESELLAKINANSQLRPDQEDRENRREPDRSIRTAAPQKAQIRKSRPAMNPEPPVKIQPIQQDVENFTPETIAPFPRIRRTVPSRWRVEPAALTSPPPFAPISNPILAVPPEDMESRAQKLKRRRRRKLTSNDVAVD
ncbi:DEAD/DEAH box helicase [Chromatium okenii]|jgi:ATP-dependent RNA helicase RhlB|uniref:ATP-dependent RNA helicase RhlB n=1 Tax=Chromatium okenii TaxID=61644 RepID=A0A2S7XR78_9GAMM|nr:DEAD/DEAH box helicase [Chromatium okenii]MBV5307870.1 DEAD/DEAH box helicase [Chromatium okenii]PQJ95942.1 DEAD/DEAH box helicase [Chromatium okenii]